MFQSGSKSRLSFFFRYATFGPATTGAVTPALCVGVVVGGAVACGDGSALTAGRPPVARDGWSADGGLAEGTVAALVSASDLS